MKQLTKTVVSRGGGIAAQLVPAGKSDASDHAKPRPAPAAVAPKRAVVEASAAETAPDLKPKYDRNAAHRAYMKEYMRKQRAADKAAKEREK